ncbi:MAG: shikimate dehydrogenase [Deltaproteobacteria bacterium]|nr:shikimate dehydrogenase [Deltaproteobacteria bacterium]
MTPELPTVPEGVELCGVVLHPAGHTRSPAMHRAAFAACGVAAHYEAFDVEPDDLGPFMARVREAGVRQLAVSIPHKQSILEYVDEVSEEARAIGAVNTVTRRSDRLEATNTDWLGAMRALEDEGSAKLSEARAVVLGAGGTARAVAFGLVRRGAHVSVLNRTVPRAEAVAAAVGAEGAGGLDALASLEPEILVNTTSVGLGSDVSPIPADAIPRGALVMDAVYEPERTRLLRDAEARGARPLGGKWMLVFQGAEQFRLWTDREAPIDVMARAFDQAGRSAG